MKTTDLPASFARQGLTTPTYSDRPSSDPRHAQLLALYDASSEADKLLLIQIATIHYMRNMAKGK